MGYWFSLSGSAPRKQVTRINKPAYPIGKISANAVNVNIVHRIKFYNYLETNKVNQLENQEKFLKF